MASFMGQESQSKREASGLIPRVGVPYRTRNEEVNRDRAKYEFYRSAIRRAGGEPVEISLALPPAELEALARTLDAFVLPGSPADVNPEIYNAPNRGSNAADSNRERTDFALIDHALAESKPILAVCYGMQSLNVHLGGSLVQDIASELKTTIQHPRQGSSTDARHDIRIEPNTRLAKLAGTLETQVNSSHHQAVLERGRNLQATAMAPDGIIEALEWTSDAIWVTAVQWHPERMAGDPLAEALFRELVEAARGARVRA